MLGGRPGFEWHTVAYSATLLIPLLPTIKRWTIWKTRTLISTATAIWSGFGQVYSKADIVDCTRSGQVSSFGFICFWLDDGNWQEQSIFLFSLCWTHCCLKHKFSLAWLSMQQQTGQHVPERRNISASAKIISFVTAIRGHSFRPPFHPAVVVKGVIGSLAHNSCKISQG